MKIRFAVAAILVSLSALAQEAATPAPTINDPASVAFKFEWNDGIPWQSYSIQVQSDGKTHFEGKPNSSQGGDTDPVLQDFVLPEAERQKIFDVARKLNYFHGDFDSHLKHIAQTGSQDAGVQVSPGSGIKHL